MNLTTATVVFGRPVREGRIGTRRKGVVLGTSSAGRDAVVVW